MQQLSGCWLYSFSGALKKPAVLGIAAVCWTFWKTINNGVVFRKLCLLILFISHSLLAVVSKKSSGITCATAWLDIETYYFCCITLIPLKI